MIFEIVTLFPSLFESVFCDSIMKRAREKGIVQIHTDDIRNYAFDKRKSVDDYPYGGDPGMILRPDVVAGAIRAAQQRLFGCNPKVIFLSAYGEPLTHTVVHELSKEKALILLCGRYKGIDHRIEEKFVDRQISIGDYVLSGGEIPAMVVVDSVTRLLPDVLGNEASAECDSYYNGLLGYPNYTRPEMFEGMEVPEVLRSGDHAKIRLYQETCSRELTKKVRPDLWKKYCEEKGNNAL
ncbi:MAG: tRNA (guanosine(37)-N1)-methyltransferase TrmD [Chitinivibrionales bacterium]|nr:tRNA (guanosine(37)-N1)-methyltransferase TrmD [Chitinivibrionales bacterium]